jgi:ribosomal 50S subunit-recycling heat shock protein
MRIDKFLKITGLIKRRTVAKEMVDKRKVRVNGSIVKPSYEVKQNDMIVITTKLKVTTVRVMTPSGNYETIL